MTDLKPLQRIRRELIRESAGRGIGPADAHLTAQRRLEAGIARALVDRILPGAAIPLSADPIPIPPEIDLSPELLPALYQDSLDTELASSGGRKRRGSFYTPPTLVELILDRLLSPETHTVLDPACGGGAFLSDALRRFMAAGIAPEEALSRLHGCEIDPHAAALCRLRLALEALAHVPNPTESDWRALLELAARRIRIGDTLLELEWEPDFDLVIGNPPFISAKEMARAGSGEYREKLAARFQSARGAFDLGGVFVERAVKLLRPGGRLGLVVPHKLFAAEYGASLREFLAESCAEREMLDHSRESHFPGAMVYPLILLATKAANTPRDQMFRDTPVPKQTPCTQTSVSGHPVPKHRSHEQVEPILRTIEARSTPLGSLCRIQCGTAGFNAARVASGLSEGPPQASAWPFLVTGSVDRYQILDKPVRYQGHRYLRPFLRNDDAAITEGQRTLFSSPKILVAGMVKRLEAAFDSTAHALGVNLYGLTEWRVDPFFLLAVLNSAAASFFYRERFAHRHLASDFMAVNKGPLALLPIPEMSDELADRLAALAKERERARADAEIDRLLFDFYGLDEAARSFVLARLPEVKA